MLSVDCRVIYLLRTTAERVVIKNNLKYLENIGLSGTKSSTITNGSYSTQIPTTRPLIFP
jgi:hypothetical protein